MRALRTAVLLGVVGAVAVGLVAGLASAAGKPNNPTITFMSPSPAEGATLTTNSVTFAFTYNRTAKQTKSLTCVLAGPTPSSGDSCANLAYNNLANGDYTFTVALNLTDGGTASATRHFTVNVPVISHLYWTNYLPLPNGTITEANLDGGNPQTIATGQFRPFAVAADAKHLYWANTDGIKRSDLDGSNPQTIVATTGGTPSAVGLAVDASHLYWVTFSSVVEANLDGSNPQTIGTTDNSAGVAVDANHLYWSNEDTGSITRSNLDGSNPQTIATGQSGPIGVAVDASHLYWSNFGTFATNFTDGTIVEANLDGSNPQTIAIGQAPVGVAVNASHLYWSNFGTFPNFTDGTIVEANLDGSNPQTIATGQNQVAGLALSPG